MPNQDATSAPTKKKSPLKLSVQHATAKKTKKKKFAIQKGSAGSVQIIGRPDWNTRAKGLVGNAQKGKDLDRRHLIHFDEEIKPFGTLVLEKVIAKHGAKSGSVIKTALESRGCTRLPKGDDDLMKRLILEVNSSVINLVPDDAAINKAIEIVRANLRKLRRDWVADPQVQEIFATVNTSNYHQATQKLKAKARLTLTLSGATTDISSAIQTINKDLIDLIDGAADAHALFVLIGELENSVTFDISAKAGRDKIEFTNRWRRKREALEANARGGIDNTDELLDHLVALIEPY